MIVRHLIQLNVLHEFLVKAMFQMAKQPNKALKLPNVQFQRQYVLLTPVLVSHNQLALLNHVLINNRVVCDLHERLHLARNYSPKFDHVDEGLNTPLLPLCFQKFAPIGISHQVHEVALAIL